VFARNPLTRFIAWGEDLLRRGERGDEDALNWFGFVNLTAITVLALIVVLILWIWL
jgi:hypothetical protein